MATTSVSGLEASRRSEVRGVVLPAVAVAGIVATIAMAWAVANSPILLDPRGAWPWRSLIVASNVAAGAYTWWRRPESRLGPLVAGIGFVYSTTLLNASGAPLAYTLGMVLWAGMNVYAAYVWLCFPRGCLESRPERGLILIFALGTAVIWALILALSPTLPPGGDFTNCGMRCPHNALQIVSGHGATGVALNTAYNVVSTIAVIGIAMLIFNKARSPAHLRRRAVEPLAAVFIANIAEFVIFLFVAPAYPGTQDVLKIVEGVLAVAVPAAIVVGQLRGDMFAARSLGQIAVGASGKPMTTADVQTSVADALGDSTVSLALWAPERGGYVDVHGASLELPSDTSARGVTQITQDGRPAAVLIHDPTLDTHSDIVQGLVATSLMLLENARLVEDLRASRSRIVATAERERRRLELDLHDGAQQRLMAIQIKLRLAEGRVQGEKLTEDLRAIGMDAQAAVDELRTLAHGIYPTVLRDWGLAKALRSFAATAPISVRVDDEGIGRCSAAIEAAIYFCSLEAVQNAIKHAGSQASVTVTLGRNRDSVHFAIADDGVGTDDLQRGDGLGLTSMRDRIGAVGGELEIISSPDRGTIVRGTVPDDGSGHSRSQLDGDTP